VAISPEDEEIVKVKWGAALAFNGVKLCFGGAERFETVAKAMELVKDEAELIAVHDSVRCCLTNAWLDELFKTGAETGAAMLACPVVATLKKVEGGKIIDTVNRSGLYEAQTPQVFDSKLLKKAYAKLDSLDKSKITDDAQLVEAMGQAVHIVETDHSNIKILNTGPSPNRPARQGRIMRIPCGEICLTVVWKLLFWELKEQNALKGRNCPCVKS
jgi:2-C-methyl-D-erythritol 4-phosphate cytidylyltransferase